MIHHMIYTQATKDKVIKPSQWKDDMYISLNWRDDNIALPCGCHYTCCTCEGSDPVDMGREDDGYFG